LLRLVDDLHTLTLADTGELPIECRPIAPRQLLERVAETYRHSAEQHGITLRLEADDDLPDVSADAEQMTRALSNLVSNALRFTPTGGTITLAARRETKDLRSNESHTSSVKPQASNLVFTVEDTGAGIPAEHLPSIFERFYRADPSRQQATGGSGLGLAIVRSIVEAHGGKVSAASAPGKGALFTIVLPAAH
jgi:signal transduction histidine kinase